MSREKTIEEVRTEFMDYVRHLCFYWSKADVKTELERCEGMAHSMLVVFDGCSSLPAFDLVVRPHPDDKEFNQEEGENWYPDGVAINDDCHLKTLLYRKD